MNHRIRHGMELDSAPPPQYFVEYVCDEVLSTPGSTIEMNLLGSDIFITDRAEHIKAVQADQLTDSFKGQTPHNVFSSILGDSVFTTEGPLWKTSREKSEPNVSRVRPDDIPTAEVHIQKLLRLIKNSPERLDAKVQMWGYSGGALASEWAAELQANYAPEIPFVSMAIGGVTPDVNNVFTTINKGLFAGIAAAGFIGLGNANPDFGKYVQDSLKPETADAFNQAGEMCFYGDVKTYADPISKNTIRTGATMGLHGTPFMPIFVYKAAKDEISPIADTDALVDQFCKAGVSITYVRDSFGEHFTQAATSTGDVLNYLTDRFNGVPISGCDIRNEFLDLLDAGSPGKLGISLVMVLLNALGVPLGPNHSGSVMSGMARNGASILALNQIHATQLIPFNTPVSKVRVNLANTDTLIPSSLAIQALQ
ncbi:hypothetical protein J4E91_002950 [Alternaria rosae]|nr:hypothetical protein J4E91_002950 [Alternaria rosae]